ncbi:MAG: sigma-70 family RNA polymerase sigma factor [Anaerolineales bacterium]|nr:MAG: sigma-70 family RNA polymerase sigma factor [Anaerolineales bacterium]
MKGSPDTGLVRLAQGGDKDAFTELFTRYEGRIFGYVYRMVGNRAWAEDIAQDAFIRAHQQLGRLGPPHDFKSWVYRIAGNLAVDSLRRHKTEVPLPDWDAGETAAPEPADQRRDGDPERQAQASDVRNAVWRALHELSDNYRRVLVLRELEGLSYTEIAAAAAMSLGNVRVTLHRARRQFRDLYGLQVMVEEGKRECHELDELLSAFADGELDRGGRKRVKDHIASCPQCERKQRDLLQVSSLLGLLVPAFPPPTLRASFQARLADAPPPPSPPVRLGGVGQGGGSGGGGPIRAAMPPWVQVLAAGGAIVFVGVLALSAFLALRSGFPGGFEDPPTPTPTPLPVPQATATPEEPTVTPSPSPTPGPQVGFWASDETVQAGGCVAIQWYTYGAEQVYFDGNEVAGSGSLYICPCDDHLYTLDVVLPDGSHDVRQITVDVLGECIVDTPTPTPIPDQQPPPAPQLMRPKDDALLSCGSTVTLEWNGVDDPSGIAGYYVRLQEEVSGRPPDSWQWGPIGGTEKTVTVTCGTRYSWVVWAEDGAGNVGSGSESWRFSVQGG